MICVLQYVLLEYFILFFCCKASYIRAECLACGGKVKLLTVQIMVNYFSLVSDT